MAVRGVVVDQFLLKSINVAHSLARKAEESEEIGEIAKAIDYHGTAAVILQEFLESSEGEIGFHMKLSLKCQYNYHKNRAKFLTAIDAYKKNDREAALGEDQIATDTTAGVDSKKDGGTNFSLLRKQIQTGSLMELRGIGSKLLDLVKIQQEEILYLSQQLQVINAENMALRKACLD